MSPFRRRPSGSVEITLGGEPLILLPGRAVLRPSTGELLVTDVYLGKAEAFRRAGRALPPGTTSTALARLELLISRYGAARLTALGALTHYELDEESRTFRELARWLDARAHLRPKLVHGIHDRHARDLLRSLSLELTAEPHEVAGLRYRHSPPADADDDLPWLAGHLQPGVLLSSPLDSLRLPVFWQRGDRGLVLPAFGEFTGAHDVQSGEQDHLFAAGGSRVIELPPGADRR